MGNKFNGRRDVGCAGRMIDVGTNGIWAVMIGLPWPSGHEELLQYRARVRREIVGTITAESQPHVAMKRKAALIDQALRRFDGSIGPRIEEPMFA